MSARRNAVRVSGHFWASELECPHCGQVVLDPVLLCRLELLRIEWGHELRLSSGYRCPAHDPPSRRAGRRGSRHLAGRAVDIPLVSAVAGDMVERDALLDQGVVPRTELERFRARAVAAGFRAEGVVDEGDHVHLEVE